MLRTARRLHQALAGRPLIRTELRWPTLGDADLAGRTVTEVVAYGKQILTRIAAADGDAPQPRIPTVPADPLTLRSHLRMEGRWYIARPGRRAVAAASRASVRAVLGGAEWTAVGTWLGLLDLIPTAAEAHADRSSRTGHHGRRLRPGRGAGGRAPVDRRPAAARRRRAARSDHRRRHRHHVHGRGPVRAEDVAVDADRRGRHPGAAGHCPASVAARRHSGSPDHHRQSAPRPGEPGCTADPASPANAAARSFASRRSGRRSRSDRRSTARQCQPGPTPTDDGRPRNPLGANPKIREDRRPTGYRRGR